MAKNIMLDNKITFSNTKVILLILGFLATIQLSLQIPTIPLPLKLNTQYNIESFNIKSLNHMREVNNDFKNRISSKNEFNNDSNKRIKEEEDLNLEIKTPGQKLIHSIPKEDRAHFIVYHLAEELNNCSIRSRTQIVLPNDVGIPYDKYLEFKNITTYDNFSKDLLDWTKIILATDNTGINKFVRTRSACPSWGCFDPNDIGQMCCPF
ncbi:uncharacterized protein LOC129609153 [Condylostylus longicornis]|uniref:uncharacterized protein LOC129609153 n=1 Tax=Condylostylus longicornis TaxID=2530218 RepID=UPI00244E5994|nr:uncharacterized protein LOC129609153 [Condylostylus longicornis]